MGQGHTMILKVRGHGTGAHNDTQGQRSWDGGTEGYSRSEVMHTESKLRGTRV